WSVTTMMCRRRGTSCL
ncbi:hypothetical protein ABKN59_011952, partial [Abortiporus biennis]